jgi:hypothetical protein
MAFAKLGTSQKFRVLRPTGFPKNQPVFSASFPSLGVVVIRTDSFSTGWRIDRQSFGSLWETIPGLESYYETPDLAAKALLEKVSVCE